MLFDDLDIDFNYTVDANTVMNKVDAMSQQLCMDDYLCVVAEGLSAWFWMRAAYEIPAVCLNPVLDPDDFFSDYDINGNFIDISDRRECQTQYALCIVTDEFDSYTDDYESFFWSERVIRFDGDIYSDEFCAADSDLTRAVQYTKEHFQ